MRRLVFLALMMSACKPDPKTEPVVVGVSDSTTTDIGISTHSHDVGGTACDPPTNLREGAATTQIGPDDDLQATLDAATPADIIQLAEGSYTLQSGLVINKSVTLRGDPAVDREEIRLVAADHSGIMVDVNNTGVQLQHLTLENAFEEAIVLDATVMSLNGFVMHDVHILNPRHQGVVARSNDNFTQHVDSASISCSHIQVEDSARDDIRDACSTGGIDVEGGMDWVVRENVIEGMYCDSGAPGPGIRFTRGARDVLIARNKVLDSPIGIVAGQGRDQIGRQYVDGPCGTGFLQVNDVTIHNNMVGAWNQIWDGSVEVEAGIWVETGCEVEIIHNTIALKEDPTEGGIVHRYETTTGVVANNLLTHGVLRQSGSLMEVVNNPDTANQGHFYSATTDDFHLAPAATEYIDAADAGYTLADDYDGQTRTGPPDVGADET